MTIIKKNDSDSLRWEWTEVRQEGSRYEICIDEYKQLLLVKEMWGKRNVSIKNDK